MYSLVIDLEMCKVPKLYRKKTYKYATEIIQIGAVLLDEELEEVDTFSQYVHPEYGMVDPYIRDLTGIKNGQIKHMPKLEEALREMMIWLDGRKFRLYAWSDNDYIQLQREIRCKNIREEGLAQFLQEDNWTDYQEVFGKRYGYEKSVSLTDALLLTGLEVDGRLHDGLYDAINTANLIRKLEQNPDYQLNTCMVKEETEPLMTCLGDLFANISL